MLLAEKIKWIPPPRACARKAKGAASLVRQDLEREGSRAWAGPTPVIPSPPLGEPWEARLGLGVSAVQLPSWQQKPGGTLLGTQGWAGSPAAVSPLLPSRHSAPLSAPAVPQNAVLRNYCSLELASSKGPLLADDEVPPSLPFGFSLLLSAQLEWSAHLQSPHRPAGSLSFKECDPLLVVFWGPR